MKTKYNYVFLNIAEDFIFPCYHPLKQYPFVKVYKHAFDTNAFLDKIFFLHWSQRLNAKFRLPFKSLWFNLICRNDFKDDKPICYVFYAGKYITEHQGLYEYIKRKNPENKCIVYYGDLISKKCWDIPFTSNFCDYIVTYDRGEAEKYGIHYFEDLTYATMEASIQVDQYECDVYFLGYAKDRLDMIHAVYKRLHDAGLKCKFIVCGVDTEDQLESDGLYYQAPIPYSENIKNVINSKCVLELIQGDSVAPTLRLKEAQIYKRKLLTNNSTYLNAGFYNSKTISIFDMPDQIDLDFLSTPMEDSLFDATIYDPIKRIEYFEGLLE